MKLIFDKYYATDCGNIYSTGSKKIIKPYKNKRGYFSVKLSVEGKAKTYLLHRMIALAFFGKSDLTVDHIDNNKSNNKPSNLRYITAKLNHEKASKDGAIKGGIQHYRSLFTIEDIQEIRLRKMNQYKLAKFYNTNQSIISRIQNRKTYKNV